MIIKVGYTHHGIGMSYLRVALLLFTYFSKQTTMFKILVVKNSGTITNWPSFALLGIIMFPLQVSPKRKRDATSLVM